MEFSFIIPDAQAATTLANISSNYSTGNMITTWVAIVVLVAVLCAVIFIVWGGVMLILSGGKDEKVKPAINSIRYSVIWLIVIVIALFIAPKIVEFMGLENMKQYLGPDVIFRSIKNIANGVFSGDAWSGDFLLDSWSPSSNGAPDFTDL
jgi:formate hydrogenlyase subunit 3/multisubunit Na+/H+ antiporter MnhD subunit